MHRSFRLFNIILHKLKVSSYYHPEIAPCLELYTCNLKQTHILPYSPPPVLQPPSPWFTSTLRTFSFSVRSVKNMCRCSKHDIFYDFDIFTAFFPSEVNSVLLLKKTVISLYKKHFAAKWQHFSPGQNGGLWILCKRKLRRDMKSSFPMSSLSAFFFFFSFLTGVNFVSSRIEQFIG